MLELKKQKNLCIFFVITEREIEDGEFESCIFRYLDFNPTQNHSVDFFVFINKISSTEKIEKMSKIIESSNFVDKITFINLNLSQELDCFWYPWSFSQKIKPKEKPKLGYTSGANVLFYDAIEYMLETDYKDFLMLECDTKPVRRNWFDVVYNYCKRHRFEIAGSTYKGISESHTDSEYKDHINGVAIYRNSKKTKELIAKSKKIVERECGNTDYLNFDVANLIAKMEEDDSKKFSLRDTEIIVNISDPVDQNTTDDEIRENFNKAVIAHQKAKKHTPILDQSVFSRDYEESIPVLFCSPKCASEYSMQANVLLLEAKCKRSKTRPVILKITTKNNSKIIVYCEAGSDFFILPDSLFKDINGKTYITDLKTFNDLIINNYVKPFSMAIDFRNSIADIDETAFYIFKGIVDRIKKSPALYLFLRHPFEILKSSFPTWENMNFRGIEPDAQERRRRFNMFSTLYPTKFLQKRLMGSSYDGSREQKNHFFGLLSNFYVYDVSLAPEVISSMFKHFCGISLSEAEPVTNINPTRNLYDIDFGVFMKAKIAQNVWSLRSQEDIQIYQELAKREFKNQVKELMTESILVTRNFEENIPVFFHIPKNAGTFIIATMNKFFVRSFKIKPDDLNFQRLSVHTSTGHEIKAFVYFNHGWGEDKDIKIFKNLGDQVRARHCDLKTFFRYVKNEKLKLLALVVEPAGKILDLRNSFYQCWEILKESGKIPINFCVLRNAYDRASSIYNYLNSEESSHEKTHGVFNHLATFQDYIRSDMLEDSWTIRALTGAPSQNPLNEHWKNEAAKFFYENDFLLADIKQSEVLLSKVLAECFEERLKEVDTKNINANKSAYKKEKVRFEELTMPDRDTFLKRTKWDSVLYEDLLEKKD